MNFFRPDAPNGVFGPGQLRRVPAAQPAGALRGSFSAGFLRPHGVFWVSRPCVQTQTGTLGNPCLPAVPHPASPQGGRRSFTTVGGPPAGLIFGRAAEARPCFSRALPAMPQERGNPRAPRHPPPRDASPYSGGEERTLRWVPVGSCTFSCGRSLPTFGSDLPPPAPRLSAPGGGCFHNGRTRKERRWKSRS